MGDKNKELIEQAAGLYIDLSSDEEVNPEEVPAGKEMKEKQEQAMNILKNVAKVLKDPKEFIKEGKKIVEDNEDIFATGFAEPYLDDFINLLLLDIYKKKIIEEKEFEKLKKDYEEEGIDVYV